jgi:DNA-binding NarL/FixJ family response regulator
MNSNEKIKIVIVGDYLIFRHGLKMLIESRDNFRVIGEVAKLSEVPLAISNNKPDVLLVDSAQIVNDGFENFLSSHFGNIPTLVLTDSFKAKTHQKYLLLGASGVVTKKQKSEVLFKAIERVNSDDLWFKREVMKKTIEKLLKEKKDAPEKIYYEKYASLTEREREVLSKICEGMKNKEIADALFITETTVRHHLTSIYEKLNVRSRSALAILAFNEKLVEIPSRP